MTQTYRTDDFGRWGAGKGSDLDPGEVDINFWDIIARLLIQEARPDPSAGISSFSTSGTQFYVHMTNLSVLGPYDLPVALFSAKGEWQPSFSYAVLDTFTINGSLYVVLVDHVSDTSFDAGANDGMGHDFYSLMLEPPGTALPTGGAVGQVITKSGVSDFQNTYTWKFPDSGAARMVPIQQSGTQDDVEWEFQQAEDVEFTPVTGSTLSSDNVADALEELTGNGIGDNVTFTPATGSALTSDNVNDAINELESIASTLGRHSVWVPASQMTPLITDGAASNTVETAVRKNIIKTLDYDASTGEHAQFDLVLPKSWDLGDLFFKVYWSHGSTTVNFGVAWSIEAAWANDGDTLDATLRGPVTLTDTGGSNNTQYVTAESSALDINFPTSGCFIMVRVSRDPSNGSDTMAIDARLMGVEVFYTTNAATDD